MQEYPMTFEEFARQFSTEKQCREHLVSLRRPNGFRCPKRGNDKARPAGEILYECRKCGRQASAMAGAISQDARKPLATWFTAIWRIARQRRGASAEGLKQTLGLKSCQTAWTRPHKTRRAMARPGRERLSGAIEVDETCLGGFERGGKRGRGTGNKEPVAMAVEREGKRLGRAGRG
jgi:hypothetical protein